jgi:flagellar motility protein MotE (MotC chaperone)
MTDKKLTKEEAQELYDDLSKAMSQMMMKRKAAMASTKVGSVHASQNQAATPAAKNAQPTSAATYTRNAVKRNTDPAMSSGAVMPAAIAHVRGRGQMGAIAFVVLFCIAKIAVSALEAVGVGQVEPAQASVVAPVQVAPQWSKEEVKILTALDHRRAELEERSGRLEQREHEFAARDRDLAVRLTELKELTERLKIEREKGEKQRNVQLDQLANVYGSMNPPEAAHLLEQLDISIAHSLIQRMPEKRIGQILALMNAERALELTNRLSSKSAK